MVAYFCIVTCCIIIWSYIDNFIGFTYLKKCLRSFLCFGDSISSDRVAGRSSIYVYLIVMVVNVDFMLHFLYGKFV